MRSDFCAFILSHGRAENVITYTLLRRCGYTGRIFIVIDNEDSMCDDYKERYGDDVIVFNKRYHYYENDFVDNFDGQNQVINARNALWDIAKELGYKYFIELDDDYYYFGIRLPNKSACCIRDLDRIFTILVEYIESTNITSIAFSQGGDHIGGFDGDVLVRRKVMNSFVCCVDRPFKFIGRINEDTTMYTYLGGLGFIFLTIMNLQLDQKDTQSNQGGLTDIYLDLGTFVKSFYSVIVNPSCVCVKSMGVKSKRLHHSINWENAVPCIIPEDYKK